jgi:hypothetical protein
MINYSAYWQAQQRKQSDTMPEPQKELKQPKKDPDHSQKSDLD